LRAIPNSHARGVLRRALKVRRRRNARSNVLIGAFALAVPAVGGVERAVYPVRDRPPR
jgi:hypothetical protein